MAELLGTLPRGCERNFLSPVTLSCAFLRHPPPEASGALRGFLGEEVGVPVISAALPLDLREGPWDPRYPCLASALYPGVGLAHPTSGKDASGRRGAPGPRPAQPSPAQPFPGQRRGKRRAAHGRRHGNAVGFVGCEEPGPRPPPPLHALPPPSLAAAGPGCAGRGAAFPGIARDHPARSLGIRTPSPSAPERPGTAPGCLQRARGRAPGGPRSEHPVRGDDDPAREAHGRQGLWEQPREKGAWSAR
ncbi:uncharacterized protein LOC114673016 [Macaca mulatta]